MALKELSIRNFAIIKQLEIELDGGLTVITGETGAGKSIVLGALNLLLGTRAEANMIRHGEDQCEISALFDLSNLVPVQAWLAARDLQASDAAEDTRYCLIRRIVRSDKPTKCYINDQPTTLASLKEVGAMLVDLHSQHEHQSLLRKSTQRQIIDQFAGHQSELRDMATLASRIHRLERELQTILDSNSDATDRMDLMAFQIQELEEAQLTENEFEQLNSEQARLANTDLLQTGIQASLDALHLNDNSNVSTELGKQIKELEELAQVDTSLKPVLAALNNALSLIEDSKGELEVSLARIDADPERLLELDQRMDLFINLARKHRCTEDQLLDRLDVLQTEYTRLNNLKAAPQRLQKELVSERESYLAIAKKVSARRQKVAATLSSAITAQMQDLGMQGGKLTIRVEPATEPVVQEHGIDDIDYLVSTNQGMPLQALNKTASGGELSRISLAIQVITSQQAHTPCLVFDEVDVGVGGKVADIVGERLQTLGQHAQVICITHLPQVAAHGQHHFAVDKITSSYETYSTLLKLDDDKRLEEVSRMLGGTQVTDQTRAHAAEMLNQSTQKNVQAAS